MRVGFNLSSFFILFVFIVVCLAYNLNISFFSDIFVKREKKISLIQTKIEPSSVIISKKEKISAIYFVLFALYPVYMLTC